MRKYLGNWLRAPCNDFATGGVLKALPVSDIITNNKCFLVGTH